MDDCIFCKIIRKELPAEIIYEDDYVLAFNDISPQAPIHFLVIPKTHYANLSEAALANEGIVEKCAVAIAKITHDIGIDLTGHRVVINTGKDGLQTVDHLHFHVLGQRMLQWPPG